MPALSIITINYNNAIGLQKTMESVFAQSFTDYEYIIIDAGSADGSKEVIEKYADKLAYWVSEKDKGIYNAMNKGIDKAGGEYLLFLNSGDYLKNAEVCTQMLSEVSTDIDIIYGNLDVIIPDGKNMQFIAPEVITIDYMLEGTIFHPASFIKKRLFEKYGKYDESLQIVADWAFFFKVIVTGKATCQYINLIVSVYSKDGISSKEDNQKIIKEERAKIINRSLPVAVKNLLEERNLLLEKLNNSNLAFRSRKKLFKQLLKRLREDIILRFK